MKEKLTPLQIVERRIQVLDSNRATFVGKCEAQYRWMKSSEKTFMSYRHAEQAMDMARHATELAVNVAKLDTFNEGMRALYDVFVSLGGKKLPDRVVLVAKPKYKR